jgi:hypothetical protein
MPTDDYTTDSPEKAVIVDYGGEIVLLTGKRIIANRGIIGLSPQLDVTEGYDGTIESSEMAEWAPELTRGERIELADIMIERWERYRRRNVG